ncbi:MAG: amino acid permease [Parachlamydiales bacterium]|nr:amino acid permease [Parachlamydiales bacterium]
MKQIHLGHVIGGAFLVAGTSIGAGMLALPVVSSLGGFFPSLIVYIISWIIMTSTGLLYLEIALNMPKDSNIISMSQKYLGDKGRIFSWIVYLFLFYCLSVAYLSQGGALVQAVFKNSFTFDFSVLLFLCVLGFAVYKGAQAVDRINILLVIGLVISYFIFIVYGARHVEGNNLLTHNAKYSLFSFPVILISFGYQGIMPSLTYYMKRNARKIKTSIILGTSLAFLVYLVWEFLILGIVPVDGKFGLREAFLKGQSAIEPLKYYTKIKYIYLVGQFFSFFAITTSFLGVSLGLFDFIADGFKIQKKGYKKVFIAFITFMPPLIITLINPNLFLIALDYAGGIGGVLLLILLPTLMVWSSRYFKKEKDVPRQLFGGKISLIVIILFALFVLTLQITSQLIKAFS